MTWWNLQDLINRAEFNGKNGVVVGPWTNPDDGSEWLIVEVDGNEFAVKPANLVAHVSTKPVNDKEIPQAQKFFFLFKFYMTLI